VTGDPAAQWMRWIARGIGSLAAAWWLFIGIVELVWPHAPQASMEGAVLAGLMGTTILGVLIAWWKERIGGTIVVVGAVALCVFAYVTAGHNKVLAVLVSGGPFLVAGILHLVCWWRS
jgi:hypothetical protein